MGFFSRFENKMEDTFEGAAGKMSKAPISPVQIAKKAEKQMRREVMVGAGREYAPTLYTVLVNPDDDARLFGYYPTLAGEIETYLDAKAAQEGYIMDGAPLVRFVVDDGLKHGKLDVIAELVSAPIVSQLRNEELQRYGLLPNQSQHPAPYAQQPQGQPQGGYDDGNWDQGPNGYGAYENDNWDNNQNGYDEYADGEGYEGYAGYDGRDGYDAYADSINPEPEPAAPQRKPPLPYVPEEEIDRSIDYGEYTFNSEDFEDYREKAMNSSEFGEEIDYPQAYGQQSAPVADPQSQQPAQRQTPNTVTFTGGEGAAPNQHVVHARITDLTYQRSYDLAGTSVTIGRETYNDIVVQDINASRKHAELRLNHQGIWTITDLKSMNGTLVNGISVASHPLYPGDVITIGKTDFEFTVY